MRDIMGLMKQAKEMQANLARVQEEVALLEAEGVSGGGLVKVVLGGKGELKRVAIDPSLLKADEGEIVEDLIVAAHTDAKTQLDAKIADKMRDVTGGLSLPPGLKLPF